MNYVTLNNGNKMPMLGIGTFTLSPDEAENSVYNALKLGYRLIDTANVYVNEKAVGRAIKKANVPREEIFLETKLWPTLYEDNKAIDKTLKRLDTDYIDLLLLHQPAGNYINGYKMMEQAVKYGKVKSIGLSNFSEEQITEILNMCEIKPTVIQVESHPYYPQDSLRKFLSEDGIYIEAWYPLGHGDSSLINESVFDSLANKYGKSKAQIILRWHIQKGNIAIPGARSEAHIKDNIDIFDFELTDEEMNEIEKINKNTPYFTQTKESLDGFLKWQPDIEGQK